MKSSKTNPGGGIKVNLGSDRNKKAWMKIKPDMTAQQRHISQLAFFLLDRLLGLYVTVPTTGLNIYVFLGNLDIRVFGLILKSIFCVKILITLGRNQYIQV